METFIFRSTSEISKERWLLEDNLKVKIRIDGRKVVIDGAPIDEYEASLVLDAINFGYPARTALLLKDESVIFRKLSLKDFTRRKNLEIIKGRLIGTHGRTKHTIENLAGCKIIIKENEIGILCDAEEIDYVITAITNLIRGAKQANVYKFLENINAARKRII